MNIFLHELRAYRKSTIVWTLSLSVLVIFFMSLFPSIAKDADQFKKLLEGYPVAVRKAIGLEIDSLFTVLGFYSYTFIYISLCGAIQAMNLGTSIVSKEVREKTADFLLTKPVTRSAIMTGKILAAITSLFITNVVFIIFSSLIVSKVATNDYNHNVFILISISLLFLQLIFFALGLIGSILLKKVKSVLTVSLGTVFTFFIIAMISSASGNDAKRYFSPFKYFDTGYIMKNSSYEVSFLVAGGLIIMASMIASYVVYSKRDIHAV